MSSLFARRIPFSRQPRAACIYRLYDRIVCQPRRDSIIIIANDGSRWPGTNALLPRIGCIPRCKLVACGCLLKCDTPPQAMRSPGQRWLDRRRPGGTVGKFPRSIPVPKERYGCSSGDACIIHGWFSGRSRTTACVTNDELVRQTSPLSASTASETERGVRQLAFCGVSETGRYSGMSAEE